MRTGYNFSTICLTVFEILVLTALVLVPRCANYRDVFVDGQIYFTDADCYARMTRVQKCVADPLLVIRHHDFENFPRGTIPHTTALFDYAIVTIALLLRPLTTHAVDLAGALISPILGLLGAWFLWCWSRLIKSGFRWPVFLIYALSPILVHGTILGRPDHQSLLLLLLTVAFGAECMLVVRTSVPWSLISGAAWSLSIWVSLYEPLVLLIILVSYQAVCYPRRLIRPDRKVGWTLFGGILFLAALVERRLPQMPFSGNNSFLLNWLGSIGELERVSITDPIWFRWCGWLLLAVPFLLYAKSKARDDLKEEAGMLALLVVSFLLTVWQARWSYFFALSFVFVLPQLLDLVKRRWLALTLFGISLFPLLQDWDARIWPNEPQAAVLFQHRVEEVQLRAIADAMRSRDSQPFVAPWWLSPALSYWSQQPGVAGSSHESLPGIVDTAELFLSNDPKVESEILRRDRVCWVIACDEERVLTNAAQILGRPIPPRACALILDRQPSEAPPFLQLILENAEGKLYMVKHF